MFLYSSVALLLHTQAVLQSDYGMGATTSHTVSQLHCVCIIETDWIMDFVNSGLPVLCCNCVTFAGCV